MLASTVQFSTNNQPPPQAAAPDPTPPQGGRRCTTQDSPGTKKAPATPGGFPPGPRSPLPQDPTACLRTPPAPDLRSTPTTPTREATAVPAGRPRPDIRTGQRSTLEHHPTHSAGTPHRGTDPRRGRGCAPARQTLTGELLLRKEVIQPHLPVRLPCYDFVPIADPAFDGSLPVRGWATGFGRYRLS